MRRWWRCRPSHDIIRPSIWQHKCSFPSYDNSAESDAQYWYMRQHCLFCTGIVERVIARHYLASIGSCSWAFRFCRLHRICLILIWRDAAPCGLVYFIFNRRHISSNWQSAANICLAFIHFLLITPSRSIAFIISSWYTVSCRFTLCSPATREQWRSS